MPSSATSTRRTWRASPRSFFGDWESAPVRARRQHVTTWRRSTNLSSADKANACSSPVEPEVRDDTRLPRAVLGNYMMGGGFLNSRLATRIRQKEGLSYGGGSQLSASPQDETGNFVTFAIYAPQNVEKLEAAFKDEIARMLKEGFTAQEIEAAKSGTQSRRSTGAGRGSSAHAQFGPLPDRTSSGTPIRSENRGAEPAVVAAMRRTSTLKITIIKSGDFAKGAAKEPDRRCHLT